jgi:hypothetical protein
MPLADPALPYGLRDIKVIPINADGSLGTAVDLPVAQTLSFSEAEEYQELRGDDRLVAVHGQGPTVEFDLEAGGISLEAWKVMSGGTLTELGATPTQTKSLNKKTTDSRPYFRIEGQAINDVYGDTHVIIYKAKVTENIEGEMTDGEFFVTSCSGQGIGNENDDLYTFTWNETQTAISGGGQNEIQLIASSATGGTFTITYSAQTTTALDWDSTAQEVEDALVALSNIAPGDVNVTGVAGQWYIEFMGTLAQTNIAALTLGVGSLTGGTAIVTTIQQGSAP